MESVDLNKVNSLLDYLICQSKEYVFREINIPMETDYWFKSNLGIVKSGKIKKLSSETSLKLDVNIDAHAYLSYKDRTINFITYPQFDCDILPGKRYKIAFNGVCEKALNVRLYIIAYNEEKKIQQVILNMNKEIEFEFDENCKRYRIALRFAGKGKIDITSIKFEPVKLEIKNKEIIYDYNLNNEIYQKRKIEKVEDVKIACILDEFSYSSFSKECKMITFTPHNFIEVLEQNRPDFLLVESAWKGVDGSWEFKIAKYNNQDKSALIELLNYCKAKNIPTVFWNKEDPIHFEKFIDTAKLFDHVFTTDRNIINEYKEKVGHNNVYSLPFAAQVKSNNPINKYQRKKGVCFAGSYYGNRHADRKRDMDNILAACKNYNLEIYDRNYNKTVDDKKSPFRYPDEFQENVKGSLAYSEIDKAYKGYEVMLNVNSVKDSPTMFSRRVFEGLASGTPIISTYSRGINEMFGDIVIADDDKDILIEKIDTLMNDGDYWKELSLKGIRKIMFNHTYENRIRYMLSKLSIEVEKKVKKVSLIIFVKDINEVNKAIEIFNNSEYSEKELILITTTLFDGYIECLNKYNNKTIRLFTGEYLEKNYRSISKVATGEYITFINSKNTYGKKYLLDLIAATHYTVADIIGKKSYYNIISEKKKKKAKLINKLTVINKNEEYNFVDSVKIDRCIIKTEVIKDIPLKELIDKLKGNSEVREWFRLGMKIFSIDNNNFIENGQISNKEHLELNKIFM